MKARFKSKYSIASQAEPDTGHADLDMTSRVGLRDILFNYTGRMDMSLYRKIGRPAATTTVDSDGSIRVDVVDPDFSPAVSEFERGPETRMDDYDYMANYRKPEDDGQVLPDSEPDNGSGGDSDGADPVSPAASE